MARTFGGSDTLRVALGSIIGNYPATIFARMASTDLTKNQYPAIFIRTTNPWNGFGLFFAGAVAGDPLGFLKFGYGSTQGSYVSGQWYAVAGRANSATQADIAVDGTVTTGTTTNIAWDASASEMQIGGRYQPSIDSTLVGSVSDVALWTAYLDDAEVMSLARGFSPRRVRPQSLKLYAPMVRDLQATYDAKSGGGHSTWTTSGSPTVSAHPRSYGF